MNLSVSECQLLWVVGAAERLATLGLFGENVPLKIPNSKIDFYLELDDNREYLFDSNFELFTIFKGLVEQFTDEDEVNDDDLRSMVDLLIEYKDNRTEIVKYALSHAVA